MIQKNVTTNSLIGIGENVRDCVTNSAFYAEHREQNMSKIKIIGRLKKLMAHERSARTIGRSAEADLYAEKIAELRRKHNITQEIKLDGEDESNAYQNFGGEPVFKQESKFFKRRRIHWQEALCHNLGNYFNCRIIVFREHNMKVVIGEKEDRRRVIKSYLHLHEIAEKEFRQYLKSKKDSSLKEKVLYRNSYFYGFSYAIQMRLMKFRETAETVEQIEKVYGILPERMKDTTALVRRETIDVSKRQEFDKELDRMLETNEKKCRKQKQTSMMEINQQAGDAGFTFGFECALTDEIVLPGKQAEADLAEVGEILMEREMQRRRYALFNHFSTVETFRGVQIHFEFGDDK